MPALGINAKSAPTFWGDLVCKSASNKEVSDNQEKSQKRRFRHFLAMRQRQAIYDEDLGGEFKSLCACGAFPVPAFGKNKETGEIYETGAPGSVQLTWRGGAGGEAGPQLVHSWVKYCASPLLCFVCAPKIRYFRSQEIQQIAQKLFQDGFYWQFWTFTAPHDVTADPCEQVGNFQEAMRIFKRNFDRFKAKWGLRFYIRGVEMTDDAPWSKNKSGCHFHHHFIVFFERKGFRMKEIEEIRKFLSERWVSALMSVGLCSDEKKEFALKKAFRLDVPRKPKNLSPRDLQALSEYVSKGAAMEMSPGIGVKKGRGEKNRRITHWELMRLAFTKNPELKSRALYVMRALKGRAWLTFSRGLRDFCGLGEIKDEEILKEKNYPLVHQYDDEDWYNLDNFKGQFVLQESIIDEAVSEGIDLSDLPCDPDNKKYLDMESPGVRRIQEIADFSISMIGQLGCDPQTGEDLRVWNDL